MSETKMSEKHEDKTVEWWVQKTENGRALATLHRSLIEVYVAAACWIYPLYNNEYSVHESEKIN